MGCAIKLPKIRSVTNGKLEEIRKVYMGSFSYRFNHICHRDLVFIAMLVKKRKKKLRFLAISVFLNK